MDSCGTNTAVLYHNFIASIPGMTIRHTGLLVFKEYRYGSTTV